MKTKSKKTAKKSPTKRPVKTIMDKVKSFEDACKLLKLNPKHIPVVDMLPELHQKAIVANYKLIIIIQALNEGWQPDWSNSNEYKYYPWFYMSSFGFSDSGYGRWHTAAIVGSRLCLKNETLARYTGKKFENLYKEYMLINK